MSNLVLLEVEPEKHGSSTKRIEEFIPHQGVSFRTEDGCLFAVPHYSNRTKKLFDVAKGMEQIEMLIAKPSSLKDHVDRVFRIAPGWNDKHWKDQDRKNIPGYAEVERLLVTADSDDEAKRHDMLVDTCSGFLHEEMNRRCSEWDGDFLAELSGLALKYVVRSIRMHPDEDGVLFREQILYSVASSAIVRMLKSGAPEIAGRMSKQIGLKHSG